MYVAVDGCKFVNKMFHNHVHGAKEKHLPKQQQQKPTTTTTTTQQQQKSTTTKQTKIIKILITIEKVQQTASRIISSCAH